MINLKGALGSDRLMKRNPCVRMSSAASSHATDEVELTE
jgi:hypothetical protein